jgi:hypothetical protein
VSYRVLPYLVVSVFTCPCTLLCLLSLSLSLANPSYPRELHLSILSEHILTLAQEHKHFFVTMGDDYGYEVHIEQGVGGWVGGGGCKSHGLLCFFQRLPKPRSVTNEAASFLQEVSDAEKIKIAQHFILSSPPFQIEQVTSGKYVSCIHPMSSCRRSLASF